MTTRFVMNWYWNELGKTTNSFRINYIHGHTTCHELVHERCNRVTAQTYSEELCIIHNKWWMAHNSLRPCLFVSTCTERPHNLHKLTQTTTQHHLTPCVLVLSVSMGVYSTVAVFWLETRCNLHCHPTVSTTNTKGSSLYVWATP